MSRGPVGRCALVVLVGLAGVFALAAVAGPAVATPATENASLGADISSFMQASSVETADDVEDGQFQAALNRTEDPEERHALIEARQARLEARSERLRSQRETLGETPDVRNRSIATRISVGATELERSVNATERRADEAGVATERLSALRETARAIPGPAVAELARGVGPPPNAGPPDGSPARNRSDSPGTRDDDQPRPDAPGPSNGTSAPTDARDAERVGPSGGDGDDGGSPSGESAGGGAGPTDDPADDTPGGRPPSDGPTAPDADPDDERGGNPGPDGAPGGPPERGNGGPPTDGSPSDSTPDSTGSNGRPTSPGDGAGAPPDSRDT
jgi:hypothetical protein